jgi:hypothetical protein
MKPIRIRYHFETRGGGEATFPLELDPQTLLSSCPTDDLPDWTLLEFRQCPGCLLTADQHPHCPAAAHLPRLVATFNHLVSHDRATVRVETEERSYVQELSIQAGMGALMGLIMATSGCPAMTFFRPMARFHLPFANQDETIFRAASAYLLADYFWSMETGEDPDRMLEGLKEVYARVHAVNAAFFTRLKVAARTDASLNALVHLDMFALMLPMQIDLRLPAIMEYFRPFLAQREAGREPMGRGN